MASPRGADKALDVITIGRASVDLYGQQIGSRLEDVTSFAKSVGGCPANIAIGTARLGLRSALLTRVGNEQFGRFLREQLAREGVALDGLKTDPERLTALAILSVESDTSFPLLFYRENCADMALEEGDIDPAFLAKARAVVVTGTHFARPGPEAAQRKAMALMRAAGGKVVLDIDYRPNLWGLAGHDAGDNRYIASQAVSERMKTVLPGCDLIVGTEEEVLIASGEGDNAVRTQVTFGLLMNLVAVANSEDKAVLWGFLQRYAPGMTPETHPRRDALVGYAIAYFRDFVKPAKSYRPADEVERDAFTRLDAALEALPPDATAEMVQDAALDVAREIQRYQHENTKGAPLQRIGVSGEWWKAIYQVLFGEDRGPRFGSFAAIYGVPNTRALIAKALAGDLVREHAAFLAARKG